MTDKQRDGRLREQALQVVSGGGIYNRDLLFKPPDFQRTP